MTQPNWTAGPFVAWQTKITENRHAVDKLNEWFARLDTASKIIFCHACTRLCRKCKNNIEQPNSHRLLYSYLGTSSDNSSAHSSNTKTIFGFRQRLKHPDYRSRHTRRPHAYPSRKIDKLKKDQAKLSHKTGTVVAENRTNSISD